MSDIIRRAPAIFEARVVNVPSLDPRPRFATIGVEVIDVWKGQVPPRTTLSSATDSGLCGVFGTLPSPGEMLLAFAHRVPEQQGFGVSGCVSLLIRGTRPWPSTLLHLDAERRRHQAAIVAAPGALAPLFDEARFRLDWDPGGALVTFQRLASDHPELAAARIGVARALLALRRFNEATLWAHQAAALPGGAAEAAVVTSHARLYAGDTTALAALRDFQALDMRQLDLTGLQLQGANFGGARIMVLRAVRADLRGASFRNASIGWAGWTSGYPRAELGGADLRGADLSSAQFAWVEGTGVRLNGVALTGANLLGTVLIGADLTRAAGQRVSLQRTDLTRATLVDTTLTGADFRRATLVAADLRRARIGAANFEFSDLRGADLRGADLRGATFFSAFYDCRTRFPPGFDPEAHQMARRHEGCSAPATP